MREILRQNLPANPGREVARVAVPVSLEFVLILGLNVVSQIIVGGLGDTAVAAVGFASSIQYIPFFVLGALGASASILVARAYGAHREKELNKVVSAALTTALIVGVIVAVPFVVWPSEIFRAVGASDAVVAAGSTYLAISLGSLFLGLLGQVLSGVLRSADHARSPMVATIVTGVLQVPIAIAMVYGWGPIPALGVTGAAWAMVIAASLKVIIMLVQTYGVFHVAAWETPGYLREWKSVLGPLVVLAAPMGLTAGFWSTGNFLYNVLVQQLGDAALAASQIVGNLEGMFFVGSLGLINAVNALVGRAVGAADGTLARAWTRYIKRVGIYGGIVFGLLFALSSLCLPMMFPKVPTMVITYSVAGVLINAVLQPVKVRNALMGAAVLPSGNDVKGVMMGDFSAPFLVGLPLSLVLGLCTPLGIFGVFIGRGIEEFAKLAIFTWRGHRLNWDEIAKKHNMLNPLAAEPAEGLIQK